MDNGAVASAAVANAAAHGQDDSLLAKRSFPETGRMRFFVIKTPLAASSAAAARRRWRRRLAKMRGEIED